MLRLPPPAGLLRLLRPASRLLLRTPRLASRRPAAALPAPRLPSACCCAPCAAPPVGLLRPPPACGAPRDERQRQVGGLGAGATLDEDDPRGRPRRTPVSSQHGTS